jgi:hypothetical protein
MAFQIGGGIDEDREALRMALGKAIAAEALDLVEAALGELFRIAAPGHAPTIFSSNNGMVPTLRNVAIARRSWLASAEVNSAATMASASPVPERAERPGSCRAPFSVRRPSISGGPARDRRPSQSSAPPQIGMDHIALDRPRPDDRDLDDEIVKFARAQAWQHVHLRAAFHLKDADAVALAEHIVDVALLLAGGF